MNGERLGCLVSVSIVCWLVSVQGGDGASGSALLRESVAVSGTAPRRRRHGPPSTSNDGVRVRRSQEESGRSVAGERRAARWPHNSVQEPPDARARPVVARSAIGAA